MKKSKTDYSRLTQQQSAFICAKVAELGSVEAVKKHYPLRALVDNFARLVARMQFKGGKK